MVWAFDDDDFFDDPVSKKSKDLPKDELLLHAHKTLEKIGPKAKVYFSYTCNNCEARVNLSEPNVLYEQGECCVCGHVQDIVSGGYTLECEI